MHPSSCSSFHTKCKHGAPSPPVAAALHTPPPPLSLLPLSPFLASYPPSPGRRWQPSRRADTSACRPWYSGVKVCLITQGQGRTIYPIHSLLLGVEINLGREAAPWTLNLYPEPKFIFLPPPPSLLLADKRCLPLSTYLHLLRSLRCEFAVNPLAELEGCCQSTYAIFRDAVSMLIRPPPRDWWISFTSLRHHCLLSVKQRRWIIFLWSNYLLLRVETCLHTSFCCVCDVWCGNIYIYMFYF